MALTDRHPKYDYASLLDGAQGVIYLYMDDGAIIEAGELTEMSISMSRTETEINRLLQHSTSVKLGARTYTGSGTYRVGQDASQWLQLYFS